MPTSILRVCLGSPALLLAAAACAQPCTPHWDTAAGTPGIAGGYAAALKSWNDGSGERIYVGGSFTSAGGSAANQYLGRWNPATGAWSPVGGGIGGGFTNAFLTCFTSYNAGAGEKLVVCGFYDNAGGVANTASLAMWNGTTWESMGTNWTGTTRGSVWAATTWNGRLYVGGGVVNTPALIGGQPWAGFASWNGTTWAPHATTISGISPGVFAMQVFNDGSGEALYVGGRFSGIDGVTGTSLIARWNGTAWSSVGGGLQTTTTFSDVEGMTVFNDGTGPALYVSGYAFTHAGIPTCSVARWNGSAWTNIGPVIGTGKATCITSFDDGGGAKLYIGGTATPGINYIARWENNAWTPVGGGVTGGAIPPSNFPSVFGLGVIGDKLYVAGNFVEVNSAPAQGLAAWTSCPACYANCDASTNAPVLNVNDFNCFLNRFAANDSWANCDASTNPPTLNVNDFNCFLNKFAAGCT